MNHPLMDVRWRDDDGKWTAWQSCDDNDIINYLYRFMWSSGRKKVTLRGPKCYNGTRNLTQYRRNDA